MSDRVMWEVDHSSEREKISGVRIWETGVVQVRLLEGEETRRDRAAAVWDLVVEPVEKRVWGVIGTGGLMEAWP